MKKKNLYLSGITLCVLSLLVLSTINKEAAAEEQKPKKIFKWKMQATSPPPEKIMGYPAGGYGHSWWIARKVKERTKGGLDIKVFPPGAIFKPREAPQAVKKGAIEMLNTVNAFTSNVIPEAPLEFCLPYAPVPSII
jgi:TRAP-type C4-dicarboxylate transport system substrate-binding protein